MRNDRESFFRYFRMSPKRLDHLLTLEREQREKTGQLAITLCYLASGKTQQSFLYSYRIGRSTISAVITETCKAIYTGLKDRYLKRPSTEDDWKTIAS